MGKASRRARKKNTALGTGPAAVLPAPFVARPFAGLAGETDWIALREIVPAATATVRVRPEVIAAHAPEAATDDSGLEIVVTTVLPMAWPGLHRADGVRFLALQSSGASGDASRDVAQVLLALLTAPAGQAVNGLPTAVADTPRLQDLLDPETDFDVQVHDGFDYWIAPGVELDEEAAASLGQADEAIIPTVKLAAAPSAYWCRVGERTHLRWILPDDEDAATTALARLHAAGTLAGPDGLGAGTRFLGAFRADGALAPVWDLDPGLEPDAYEEPLAALAPRYAQALADTRPLTTEERRARAGIVSRQLTLR